MSELLDKPHENTKYNEHLYKVLKQEGLTDKVKWKFVEKEKFFEDDRSRAQIPSNILKDILNGFEKIPIKKNAHPQSTQEEQEEYLYDFSYCDFLNDVDFREATFTGEANFWNATFNGNACFWKVTFTGEAKFCYAKFTGKADFRYSKFTGKADFWDAKFTGKADFWVAKFTGDADFRGARFTGGADFRTTKFDEVANFGASKFKKLGDFEKSVFKKQAYFLEANIDRLKIKGVHIETSVHFLDSNIKSTDRETARIIKHEYYKLNNNLEAMHWNTRELEEYRKELKKRAEKIKELKSEKTVKKQKIIELIKKEPPDRLARLVLWFQWWTTRHGTNWIQGIMSVFVVNTCVIIFMFHLLLVYHYFTGYTTFPEQSERGYFNVLLNMFEILPNYINPIHSKNLIEEFNEILSLNLVMENLKWNERIFYIVFNLFDLLFRALNISLLYLTVGAFRRLSRTK